jgi:hypothetical protein
MEGNLSPFQSWATHPAWQSDPAFTFSARKRTLVSSPRDDFDTPAPDRPAASPALSSDANFSTPKAKPNPLKRYPSPEGGDRRFRGFQSPISPSPSQKVKPSPIRGDLLQRLKQTIPRDYLAGPTHNEEINRSDFPPESFRVSPAARRNRHYDTRQYDLDPVYTLPVRLRDDGIGTDTKRPKLTDDLEPFVYTEIKDTSDEIQVAARGCAEIRADQAGRRLRIDGGAIRVSIGGSSWGVSDGGEMYIPLGQVATVENRGESRVVLTDF